MKNEINLNVGRSDKSKRKALRRQLFGAFQYIHQKLRTGLTVKIFIVFIYLRSNLTNKSDA